MPRPKPEAANDAYLVWRDQCDCSIPKTALALDIPERTLRYWHNEYRWEAQRLSELGPASEIAAGLSRAKMRFMLGSIGLERARSILEDKLPMRAKDGTIVADQNGDPYMEWASADRDAAAVLRTLAEYSLDPSAGGITGQVIDAQTVDYGQVEREGAADMGSQASRILEANVASVNTRGKRRK